MGFCAGVERAVDIVDLVLKHYTQPVFVKHEIVHNQFVIDNFTKRGVRFIEDIADVPQGAILIYSAHGVSQTIKTQAKAKNVRIFDATCPLVSKIHTEVLRASTQGQDCILVGHADHPEVEGVMGHFDAQFGGTMYLVESEQDAKNLVVKQPKRLFCFTQTTLSVDETKRIHAILQTRFPHIGYPKKNDICYATQNRQDALRAIAMQCDVVLVIGSLNSSNTKRLHELATTFCTSYLIHSAADINQRWFTETDTVGISAGASAPAELIKNVVTCIETMLGVTAKTLVTHTEDVRFSLPKELRLLRVG